ncbi:glycosyl hydrolase-related protein (plasmid) [Deinococcus taeanensis]|uniref:glycosyl hydrolase-related protein n=1 Tax=Deinococcus taeanensis TaxID=2737050 RepID=UPI001CDD2893|nr:glycosyl hydrolase-related protein [Deinococcus taeanensis]UBV44257.1 glycosyl hydrolase-related protein [Deinococcus taeanensis]
MAYTHLDQGLQRSRWVLAPHSGDWRAAGVPERADQLNEPAVFTREYVHAGPWPASRGEVQLLDLPTVRLSAVKQAEDSSDLIVRLHEWGGQAAQGTLRWRGHDLPVTLRAQQVLGLRLNAAGEAFPVNFLEEAHD